MRATHALVLFLTTLPLTAGASRADRAVGLWWAEGGAAQVEIAPCAEGLCGHVVWLRSPFDENGCPMRDSRNPDPTLRDRELVGIELLRGLRPSQSQERWTDGDIYDPTSGHRYRAVISLDGPDRLRVRGYVGIELLGRTTTWIRVQGEPMCRIHN